MRTHPWFRQHAKWLATLCLLGGLTGMLLAAAGCHAGKAPDLDEDAARPAPGPMLPPDTLQLTPAQQQQLGLALHTVSDQRLPRSFTTTASFSAPTGSTATVTSPIQGYVQRCQRRRLQPGESIHAGEVLAIVRPVYSAQERIQMQAGEQAAGAQRATLQARLTADLAEQQRSRKLYADGIAPLRQVEQDEASVAADRAALADAQARQAEYQAALSGRATPSNPPVLVRAPISGTLTGVQWTPGQMVAPAQTLLTIVNDRQLWLQIPVPEDKLMVAQHATRAVFSVAAFPGQWFPLSLVGSPGVVDTQTHTLPMIFSATNRGRQLHPGMIATVQLLAPAQQTWPVIPASALVHEGAMTVVFVATGKNQFRRRPVQVEYVSAGQAAIAHGLQTGERVVSQGAALLESELHVGNVQGDDD